jgi:hypothetical protein
LALLGDRSVIPDMVRLLDKAGSPWQYDEALLRDLVRLQAPEAFSYVVTCMTRRDDWDHDGAVSLGMLAPALSLQQRREAANCLRPLLNSDQPWLRWIAISALGELKMSTPQELLAQVQDNVLEIQEPAIGLALAQLGTYDELAAPLQNACAQRDATLYLTVLHAWGALRNPRCATPLLHTLGLPDDFLRSADHLLSGGDLAAALQHVKARAATNLGKLAASLVDDLRATADPRSGWEQILASLDNRSLAGMPKALPLMRSALSQPIPAHQLYQSVLDAHTEQQAALGWLVGAYEWSQLFVQLSRSNQLESVLIWEVVRKTFDQAAESDRRSTQKQLAGRIGWAQRELPFEYLMQLSEHRNDALHKQARDYFALEVQAWYEWLKWRANMLVLTVD